MDLLTFGLCGGAVGDHAFAPLYNEDDQLSIIPQKPSDAQVSSATGASSGWSSYANSGERVLNRLDVVAGMQRHLGLHLSASKDALKELLEAGGAKGEDYFGDHQINGANANRRHNAAGTTPWRRSRPRRPC